MAGLGIESLPDSHRDQRRVKEVADNINYRHRNAQLASRASAELFTLIFFSKYPTEAEGRVLKVSQSRLPTLHCAIVLKPWNAHGFSCRFGRTA